MIDRFMDQNPKLRDILWNSRTLGEYRDKYIRFIFNEPVGISSGGGSSGLPGAKRVVFQVPPNQPLLPGYRKGGCPKSMVCQWHKGSSTWYLREDPEGRADHLDYNYIHWGELRELHHRSFVNYVFKALKNFSGGRYGWDALDFGYFDPSRAIHLPANSTYVGCLPEETRCSKSPPRGVIGVATRPYTDWDLHDSTSPRHWTLPQMHYVGLLHVDTWGCGHNYGMNERERKYAFPVDCDMVRAQGGTVASLAVQCDSGAVASSYATVTDGNMNSC